MTIVASSRRRHRQLSRTDGKRSHAGTIQFSSQLCKCQPESRIARVCATEGHVTFSSNAFDAVRSRPIHIEIGLGEFADRLTILDIKIRKFKDPEKLQLAATLRQRLTLAAGPDIAELVAGSSLVARLRLVNERLWEAENDIRALEQRLEFGAAFVDIARSICRLNDDRAALKVGGRWSSRLGAVGCQGIRG